VEHGSLSGYPHSARTLDPWRAREQCLVIRGAFGSAKCKPDALPILHQLQLEKGYYITWQPTITANWETPSSPYRSTVPYGGGIGRIMKPGFQPVNLTLQFYANPTRPPGTSPWGMRMQIAFLFPKLTKEQQKMLMEQKLKKMEQEQRQKSPAKQ
jgi:hypothetical protein